MKCDPLACSGHLQTVPLVPGQSPAVSCIQPYDCLLECSSLARCSPLLCKRNAAAPRVCLHNHDVFAVAAAVILPLHRCAPKQITAKQSEGQSQTHPAENRSSLCQWNWNRLVASGGRFVTLILKINSTEPGVTVSTGKYLFPKTEQVKGEAGSGWEIHRGAAVIN